MIAAACALGAAVPALGQEGPDAPPPSVVEPPLPDAPDDPPVAPPVDPSPAPTPSPDPDPPPTASPSTPSGGGAEEPEEAGPTPEEIAAEEAAEAEAERQRQAEILRQERLEQIAAARAAAIARIKRQVRDAAVPAASATLGSVAEVIDVAVPAPDATGSPGRDVTLVIGALLMWVALVLGFLALERRGRTVTVVMIVLAVVLVDVTLYPSPNDVTGGLLNPSVGGFAVSLVDGVIAAGLVARLLGGRAFTTTMATVWWLAFAAWWGVVGIAGLVNGAELAEVLYQGRSILYVGLIVLAASVPPRDYLGRRGLIVIVIPAAFIAATCVLMTMAGVEVDLPLPGLPGAQWGRIGADAASVLAALGAITLAVASVRKQRRAPLLAAAGVLMVSAVFATQRAALLGVLLTGVILVVAWLTPSGRERRELRSREGIVALMCVAAALLVGTIALTTADRFNSRLPGVEAVDATFNRQGKAASADARVAQWEVAEDLIAEEPLLGRGLGFVYDYYSPGPRVTVVTTLTHNIGLDVLLRAGIVGLGLLIGAIVLSLAEGLSVWRRSADDAVAALALGCTSVLMALLLKGMVESVFEKYRLMVLMCIVIGVVSGAFTATVRSAAETRRLRMPGPGARPQVSPEFRGRGLAGGEPAAVLRNPSR